MRAAWILVLVIVIGLRAEAAERRVPDDYATIQEAVEAAQVGDTVVIAPGTYAEQIRAKTGVSLRGAGSDAVRIESDVVAHKPTFVADAVVDATVSGMTFTHAGTPKPEAPERISSVLESWGSSVVFEDIVVEGAPFHGIYLSGKSQPVLRRAVSRNNGLAGVYIIGPNIEATLEDVRAEGNGWDGVHASGRRKPCTFSFSEGAVLENEGSGVSVQKALAAIEEVSANKNAKHGFSASHQAELDLAHCRAESNGEAGIWAGSFGRVSMRSVEAHGNAGPGLFPEERAEATAEACDFTRNGAIAEEEIAWLIDTRMFATLEDRAETARKSGRFTADGYPELITFYSAIGEALGLKDGADAEPGLELVDAWRAAVPESPTPRGVLIALYTDLAWRERGSGWAYEVTEEGWRGFRNYLDKAWAVYEEARKLERQCPHVHALAVRVALGRGEDMTRIEELAIITGWKGYVPQIRRAFDRSVALNSRYYTAYECMAQALLPRWLGSDTELVAFAEESVSATREEQGETLYAVVGLSACRYVGFEEFMEYGFDWAKLQRGFEDWKTRMEDPRRINNAIARFACALDDQARAKAAFLEMEPEWNDPKEAWWFEEQRYEAYRAWAMGKGGKPVHSSPLFKAVKEGEVEQVRTLLSGGADPKQRDDFRRTPLFYAISSAQLEIARMLLEAGLDPDEPYWKESTLLCKAVRDGNEEMASLLLEYGADPNASYRGKTCLTTAEDEGYEGIAALLVEAGAHAQAQSQTPQNFMHLLMEGSADELREALDKGADPNMALGSGFGPLQMALVAKHWDKAKLLLEQGADPNTAASGPMAPAALLLVKQKAPPGLVKLAAEKGAKFGWVEPGPMGPVHLAAAYGAEGVLAVLLDAPGVDVNLRDAKERITPLHAAAERGRVEHVRLLLEQGADHTLRDMHGKTALDVARERGHTETATLLEAPAQ